MATIATFAYAGSHEPDVSLKKIIAGTEEAARADADLVVFPETSLQGYPGVLTRGEEPDVLRSAYEIASRWTATGGRAVHGGPGQRRAPHLRDDRNFTGSLGGLEFFGHSQIIDPLGRAVAGSGPAPEQSMVLADIDVSGGIEEAQARGRGARLWRDRRPETYTRLAEPTVV